MSPNSLCIAGALFVGVAAPSTGLIGCGDAAETLGGGGQGGDATAGGNGGEAGTAETLSLAIIAEDGPGNAPSMLRFSNDTVTQQLSLSLSDGEVYAFYGILPGVVTEYRPSVGTDIPKDGEIGLCGEGVCVNFPIDSFLGDAMLEPGQAYRLGVTTEDEETSVYAVTVTLEDPPDAFVGLRAIIAAPGPGNPSLPISLKLNGAPVTFEGQFDPVVPSPYQIADGSSLTVEGATFTNRFGQVFATDESFTLNGHDGYTLVVTETPPADAWMAVTLSSVE